MSVEGDYEVMLSVNVSVRARADQQEALLRQTLARWAARSLHCGLNALRFTLIPSLLCIISAFALNDPHQTNAVEQNLYLLRIMRTADPGKQRLKRMKFVVFGLGNH